MMSVWVPILTIARKPTGEFCETRPRGVNNTQDRSAIILQLEAIHFLGHTQVQLRQVPSEN